VVVAASDILRSAMSWTIASFLCLCASNEGANFMPKQSERGHLSPLGWGGKTWPETWQNLSLRASASKGLVKRPNSPARFGRGTENGNLSFLSKKQKTFSRNIKKKRRKGLRATRTPSSTHNLPARARPCRRLHNNMFAMSAMAAVAPIVQVSVLSSTPHATRILFHFCKRAFSYFIHAAKAPSFVGILAE
jgi:hypothetical protein